MAESYALIIQLAERFPMILIIIDALDECDPGKRAELLQKLEMILRESPSLVKIFLSCRDDQDIIYELQDYPNLEIGVERNRADIKYFVETEVYRLFEERKLLRFSPAKKELKALIIERVTQGAAGM